MATRVSAPLEEYLQTNYEGPDREYVDGEVVERGTPNQQHSRAQSHLIQLIAAVAPEMELLPELRVEVSPGRYRIVDLAVYEGRPSGGFPKIPPLIAVEILSPDDRARDVLDKLAEYEAWGARHIWLVDPESKKLYAYDQGGLRIVERYEVAEPEITLAPERIF